jgi:hypothetical protein
VLLFVHRVAGSSGAVGPSASTDLETWSRPPGTVFPGSMRLPGIPARDHLTFRIPTPVPSGRHFVRTVFTWMEWNAINPPPTNARGACAYQQIG